MTARTSPLTWRLVLVSQALGLSAAFVMSLEWGYFGETIGHSSLHFVCMSVYVFCLVPLVLCGDGALRRGSSPRWVYLVLLLLNSLVACGAAFLTERLYGWLFDVPPAQSPEAPWLCIDAGIHMSVYGALGVLAYLNQRTTDRILEGVRSADLRRVQLDRQLVESRLATAEAQIDPARLLSVLGEVKTAFEDNAVDSERRLDELIQTLRNALRRTAAASAEAGEP